MTNFQKLLTQHKTLAVIAIFVLTSCRTNKKIFIDEAFSAFDKLKLTTVQEFEKNNKSKDISPTHLIEIGDSIYPNENLYKIESPKVFKRADKPGFQVEIEYYYDTGDGSVKVILYQWDELPSKKGKQSDTDTFQKFDRFQAKFNQLNDSLTRKLGPPVLKNIEQASIPFGETFRDDIKWQTADGLNAYLFMSGNDKTGHRQILLAIYKY